jgi:16S rRNA processing protein RimM
MIRKEETVQIGYFARPHGIKGELSLVTDYDLFEDEKDPYVICEMDGILVPFFVESFRYKSNAVILVKLEDVDSEITAKKFVNQQVFYPVNRLKEPSADDLTWKRFTGYMLSDKEQGELGIITYVDETTMNTLFTVDYRGKELLTPVASELIVSIDHAGRKIVLALPDGILGLMVNG